MAKMQKSEIDQEIRALLDVLVEDGKCRMTFETKMKIRGYILLNEYEKAIDLMGGQAFLETEDPELDTLGELFSVGIFVREGMTVILH